MSRFQTALWLLGQVPRRALVVVALLAVAASLLTSSTQAQAAGLPMYVFGQNGNFNSNSPGSGAAGMSSPVAIAIDSVGHRMFTADYANNRVLVFDLDSSDRPLDDTPDRVLGQPDFVTTSGGVTQSKMKSPFGLAYDSNGKRLFVADPVNKRVLVYNVTTITNGMNATAVLGASTFTSAGPGGAFASTLNDVSGIEYQSSSNRLFVADVNANRVMVFDVASITNGEAAVNVLGQSSFTTLTAATSATGMNFPSDVAIDAARQRLFVSERTNSRVLVFDISTLSNGKAASHVLGQTGFTISTAATTQGSCNNCSGVAYASDQLYVSDQNNNRVLTFAVATITNGMNAIDVWGQPDYTTATPTINRSGMSAPWSIGTNVTGSAVYVPDFGNHRVLGFYANTAPTPLTFLAQFRSDGTTALAQGASTYDAVASFSATINDPDTMDTAALCVELQPLGTGFTGTENSCGTHANQGATASVTIPIPERGAFHWQARSKDITGAYSPWVQYNSGNMAFDAIADPVTATPAVGVLGQSGSYTSRFAGTGTGRLNVPGGSAVDSVNHRLFIADTENNRVLVHNLSLDNRLIDDVADNVIGQPDFATVTGGVTQSKMTKPRGVAHDSGGHRLFVSEETTGRVLVFDISTIANGMNASNVLGQTSFTSSTTGRTESVLSNSVRDVEYEPVSQRLFVVDSGNNRVLVFDAGSIVDGEAAINVLGQTDFTTGTFATSQDKLRAPVGLSIDEDNNRLFVSDNANQRVLAFDIASITNGEAAIGVLGQLSYTTQASGATQNSFTAPQFVQYVNDRLYVADNLNSRVLVFDVQVLSNGENAVGVLGQQSYVSSARIANQTSMWYPRGVTASADGEVVFVSDSSNYRILSFHDNRAPDAPSLLGQLRTDSITAIPTGATTHDGAIVFRATVTDPDPLDSDALCIELQPIGTPFTGVEAFCGSLGVQGLVRSNVLSPTGEGPFHWQARTRDGSGAYSPWVQFNGGATAFIKAADPVTPRQADSVAGQDGDYTTQHNRLGPNGLGETSSSVVDSVNHRLFVADASNHRVLVYDLDASDRLIDDVADRVLGQPDFNTTGEGTAQSTMVRPWGLSYDSTRDFLFVSEPRGRVLVFDVATIVNGESALHVLGQQDFTSIVPATSSSRLTSAIGSAYDAATQMLYIADEVSHRVLVFDVASITNGENAVNVLGQSSFTNAIAGKSQSTMNNPHGLALDSMGKRLFVTEAANNRVLVFDITTVADGMNASNVLGQLVFTTNFSGTSQNTMKIPAGAQFVGDKLYVSDFANARVLTFDVSTIVNGENAIDVWGQPSFTAGSFATGRMSMRATRSVSANANGKVVYVSDTGNYRMLGFYDYKAPNTPSVLSQYRSDGTTAIATGGVTNSIAAVFKATVTDLDVGDTNSLCVELQPTGTPFTGTDTSCGSAVAEGSTASLSLPVSDGTTYNWQARTKDSAGLYSPWSMFNSGNTAFAVDRTAPAAPSSLSQFRANGLTSLATGGWNNSDTVIGRATLSDAGSAVGVCVEAKPVNVAFTNVEDGCGIAVASGAVGEYARSTLTDGVSYHWQARAQDSAGNYSTWSSFGGNSDTLPASVDFGIDTSAPTAGTVFDGLSPGVQSLQNLGSLSELSANWSGFGDTGGSGVAGYRYSIGTTPGATNVLSPTIHMSTAVTASTLMLETGQTYYFNVAAIDTAGNFSAVVSSAGQSVRPYLTTNVSNTNITFGSLDPGNAFTASQSTNVTTSTNAKNGYFVSQHMTGLLASGSTTVPMYAGTRAAPTVWTGTGFGYTSSDTSLDSSGNVFGNGTEFAGFGLAGSGHTVADHTAAVVGAPVINEVFGLTYKVQTPTTQAAGKYTSSVVLNVVPIF